MLVSHDFRICSCAGSQSSISKQCDTIRNILSTRLNNDISSKINPLYTTRTNLKTSNKTHEQYESTKKEHLEAHENRTCTTNPNRRTNAPPNYPLTQNEEKLVYKASPKPNTEKKCFTFFPYVLFLVFSVVTVFIVVLVFPFVCVAHACHVFQASQFSMFV